MTQNLSSNPLSFPALSEMVYSGRSITLGMTAGGRPFVGYALTGRSPSSQARKLVYDQAAGLIKTEVTDPELLKQGNPALLIYSAIEVVLNNDMVVSNGAQTKLLARAAKDYPDADPVQILLKAIEKPAIEEDIDLTSYEPDEPNFTPRICGFINNQAAGFLLIKKADSEANSTQKEVQNFPFSLVPGEAKTITTYHGGNEDPLLPFSSEPLPTSIFSNDAEEITESLYQAIGASNDNQFRVSTAVVVRREDDLQVFIINKSERGS